MSTSSTRIYLNHLSLKDASSCALLTIPSWVSQQYLSTVFRDPAEDVSLSRSLAVGNRVNSFVTSDVVDYRCISAPLKCLTSTLKKSAEFSGIFQFRWLTAQTFMLNWLASLQKTVHDDNVTNQIVGVFNITICIPYYPIQHLRNTSKSQVTDKCCV